MIFRLKPIDVKFMKMLHEKVNIVPVIGKADSLTKTEIGKLKKRVSVCESFLNWMKTKSSNRSLEPEAEFNQP